MEAFAAYLWLVSLCASAYVGTVRNREFGAFALTLFLGPIGLLVAAAMPTAEPRQVRSTKQPAPPATRHNDAVYWNAPSKK